MNLTAKLKSWAVAHAGVKQNAADDVFKTAIGSALVKGTLTHVKFSELSAPDEEPEVSTFIKGQQDILAGLNRIAGLLTQQQPAAVKGKRRKNEAVAPPPAAGAATAVADPDEETEDFEDGEEDAANDEEETPADAPPPVDAGGDAPATGKGKGAAPWLTKMVARLATPGLYVPDEKGGVRSKGAWEVYGTTKSASVYPTHTKAGRPHPKAGEPVVDFDEAGRALDNPAELDKAVAGAFAKYLCSAASLKGSRRFGFAQLPQHDQELLYYAMEKMNWGGSTNGGDLADIKNRRLTPHEQKALIDDSTSGGLEAAPIVFDDQVIQRPLLHGELFPLVNTKPLDRGRRIEGVSTGTVTGSWGGVDDTAVSLFNTNSYVSAFDTTIFRWEGAIRIGLDFLSDTPIDFGQHVTDQYGERLLEDLDDVIAVGNGTTQPEGVMNKSGATSVSWGGSTTLGNYESLLFAIAKAEMKGTYASTAVFGGNYTSYMRARAIPVGAPDARRLGGQDLGSGTPYMSFNWMGQAYKINESLANTQIFFAILGRYRMYRRRGLTIKTSTEGDTLMRANEMLVLAMARYGGQMERGACVAYTTTAPA